MNRPKIATYVERNLIRQKYEVYIRDESNPRQFSVGQPIEFTPIDEGEWHGPAAELEYDEAVQLMNELWRVGIRPTDQLSTSGEKEAMAEHIKDLRKVLDWSLE